MDSIPQQQQSTVVKSALKKASITTTEPTGTGDDDESRHRYAGQMVGSTAAPLSTLATTSNSNSAAPLVDANKGDGAVAVVVEAVTNSRIGGGGEGSAAASHVVAPSVGGRGAGSDDGATAAVMPSSVNKRVGFGAEILAKEQGGAGGLARKASLGGGGGSKTSATISSSLPPSPVRPSRIAAAAEGATCTPALSPSGPVPAPLLPSALALRENGGTLQEGEEEVIEVRNAGASPVGVPQHDASTPTAASQQLGNAVLGGLYHSPQGPDAFSKHSSILTIGGGGTGSLSPSRYGDRSDDDDSDEDANGGESSQLIIESASNNNHDAVNGKDPSVRHTHHHHHHQQDGRRSPKHHNHQQQRLVAIVGDGTSAAAAAAASPDAFPLSTFGPIHVPKNKRTTAAGGTAAGAATEKAHKPSPDRTHGNSNDTADVVGAGGGSDSRIDTADVSYWTRGEATATSLFDASFQSGQLKGHAPLNNPNDGNNANAKEDGRALVYNDDGDETPVAGGAITTDTEGDVGSDAAPTPAARSHTTVMMKQTTTTSSFASGDGPPPIVSSNNVSHNDNAALGGGGPIVSTSMPAYSYSSPSGHGIALVLGGGASPKGGSPAGIVSASAGAGSSSHLQTLGSSYPTTNNNTAPSHHHHATHTHLALVMQPHFGLHITTPLGVGADGKVYKGVDLATNEVFAVKEMARSTKDKRISDEQVATLRRQINTLRQLPKHPNIVQHYASMATAGDIYIKMECVRGQSIAKLLHEGHHASFDEGAVRFFGRQIVQGLAFLHRNGIIHRDIKGANVMIDDEGVAKITDFGSTIITEKPTTAAASGGGAQRPATAGLPSSPNGRLGGAAGNGGGLSRQNTNGSSGMLGATANSFSSFSRRSMLVGGGGGGGGPPLPAAMPQVKHMLAGTPLWMAPELFDEDNPIVTPKSDVWSLACTIVEMATGSVPWYGFKATNPYSTMYRIASCGHGPMLPTNLSRQGHDFLERCFTLDPACRMSAEECLAHPFLSTPFVQDSEDPAMQPPTPRPGGGGVYAGKLNKNNSDGSSVDQNSRNENNSSPSQATDPNLSASNTITSNSGGGGGTIGGGGGDDLPNIGTPRAHSTAASGVLMASLPSGIGAVGQSIAGSGGLAVMGSSNDNQTAAAAGTAPVSSSSPASPMGGNIPISASTQSLQPYDDSMADAEDWFEADEEYGTDVGSSNASWAFGSSSHHPMLAASRGKGSGILGGSGADQTVKPPLTLSAIVGALKAAMALEDEADAERLAKRRGTGGAHTATSTTHTSTTINSTITANGNANAAKAHTNNTNNNPLGLTNGGSAFGGMTESFIMNDLRAASSSVVTTTTAANTNRQQQQPAKLVGDSTPSDSLPGTVSGADYAAVGAAAAAALASAAAQGQLRQPPSLPASLPPSLPPSVNKRAQQQPSDMVQSDGRGGDEEQSVLVPTPPMPPPPPSLAGGGIRRRSSSAATGGEDEEAALGQTRNTDVSSVMGGALRRASQTAAALMMGSNGSQSLNNTAGSTMNNTMTVGTGGVAAAVGITPSQSTLSQSQQRGSGSSSSAMALTLLPPTAATANINVTGIVLSDRSLPESIFATILSYLMPRDLGRMACSAKALCNLVTNNDGLWANLFEHYFGRVDVIRRALRTNWRQHLKVSALARKEFTRVCNLLPAPVALTAMNASTVAAAQQQQQLSAGGSASDLPQALLLPSSSSTTSLLPPPSKIFSVTRQLASSLRVFEGVAADGTPVIIKVERWPKPTSSVGARLKLHLAQAAQNTNTNTNSNAGHNAGGSSPQHHPPRIGTAAGANTPTAAASGARKNRPFVPHLAEKSLSMPAAAASRPPTSTFSGVAAADKAYNLHTARGGQTPTRRPDTMGGGGGGHHSASVAGTPVAQRSISSRMGASGGVSDSVSSTAGQQFLFITPNGKGAASGADTTPLIGHSSSSPPNTNDASTPMRRGLAAGDRPPLPLGPRRSPQPAPSAPPVELVAPHQGAVDHSRSFSPPSAVSGGGGGVSGVGASSARSHRQPSVTFPSPPLALSPGSPASPHASPRSGNANNSGLKSPTAPHWPRRDVNSGRSASSGTADNEHQHHGHGGGGAREGSSSFLLSPHTPLSTTAAGIGRLPSLSPEAIASMRPTTGDTVEPLLVGGSSSIGGGSSGAALLFGAGGGFVVVSPTNGGDHEHEEDYMHSHRHSDKDNGSGGPNSPMLHMRTAQSSPFVAHHQHQQQGRKQQRHSAVSDARASAGAGIHTPQSNKKTTRDSSPNAAVSSGAGSPDSAGASSPSPSPQQQKAMDQRVAAAAAAALSGPHNPNRTPTIGFTGKTLQQQRHNSLAGGGGGGGGGHVNGTATAADLLPPSSAILLTGRASPSALLSPNTNANNRSGSTTTASPSSGSPRSGTTIVNGTKPPSSSSSHHGMQPLPTLHSSAAKLHHGTVSRELVEKEAAKQLLLKKSKKNKRNTTAHGNGKAANGGAEGGGNDEGGGEGEDAMNGGATAHKLVALAPPPPLSPPKRRVDEDIVMTHDDSQFKTPKRRGPSNNKAASSGPSGVKTRSSSSGGGGLLPPISDASPSSPKGLPSSRGVGGGATPSSAFLSPMSPPANGVMSPIATVNTRTALYARGGGGGGGRGARGGAGGSNSSFSPTSRGGRGGGGDATSTNAGHYSFPLREPIRHGAKTGGVGVPIRSHAAPSSTASEVNYHLARTAASAPSIAGGGGKSLGGKGGASQQQQRQQLSNLNDRRSNSRNANNQPNPKQRNGGGGMAASANNALLLGVGGGPVEQHHHLRRNSFGGMSNNNSNNNGGGGGGVDDDSLVLQGTFGGGHGSGNGGGGLITSRSEGGVAGSGGSLTPQPVMGAMHRKLAGGATLPPIHTVVASSSLSPMSNNPLLSSPPPPALHVGGWVGGGGSASPSSPMTIISSNSQQQGNSSNTPAAAGGLIPFALKVGGGGLSPQLMPEGHASFDSVGGGGGGGDGDQLIGGLVTLVPSAAALFGGHGGGGGLAAATPTHNNHQRYNSSSSTTTNHRNSNSAAGNGPAAAALRSLTSPTRSAGTPTHAAGGGGGASGGANASPLRGGGAAARDGLLSASGRGLGLGPATNSSSAAAVASSSSVGGTNAQQQQQLGATAPTAAPILPPAARPERSLVYHQHKLLKHLEFYNATHVPRPIAVVECEEQRANLLVTSALGPSVFELFSAHGNQFSWQTVYRLGIRMVEAVEEIHERDIVHGNLAPRSLVMGKGPAMCDHVCLVDFSHGHFFRNPKTHSRHGNVTTTNVATQQSRTNEFLWFCSKYVQERCTPAPRDDLISIVYVLHYLLHGSLPWITIDKPLPRSEMLSLKNKFQFQQHAHNPKELQQFVKLSHGLHQQELPDYGAFKALLKSALLGQRSDPPYDWSLWAGTF